MYGLTAAVSGECCRRATMDLDTYDTYIVGLTVGGPSSFANVDDVAQSSRHLI